MKPARDWIARKNRRIVNIWKRMAQEKKGKKVSEDISKKEGARWNREIRIGLDKHVISRSQHIYRSRQAEPEESSST